MYGRGKPYENEKNEAKALANQGIANSKKYGIPLKQKRKNKLDYIRVYGHLLYN